MHFPVPALQLPPTTSSTAWEAFRTYPWFVEVESWAEAQAHARGPMSVEHTAWTSYVQNRERFTARSLLARYHSFVWDALSHPPFQTPLIASYPFQGMLQVLDKAADTIAATGWHPGDTKAPQLPAQGSSTEGGQQAGGGKQGTGGEQPSGRHQAGSSKGHHAGGNKVQQPSGRQPPRGANRVEQTGGGKQAKGGKQPRGRQQQRQALPAHLPAPRLTPLPLVQPYVRSTLAPSSLAPVRLALCRTHITHLAPHAAGRPRLMREAGLPRMRLL
jgi:hypothetical protein